MITAEDARAISKKAIENREFYLPLQSYLNYIFNIIKEHAELGKYQAPIRINQLTLKSIYLFKETYFVKVLNSIRDELNNLGFSTIFSIQPIEGSDDYDIKDFENLYKDPTFIQNGEIELTIIWSEN